jgi:hypothetical protein
MGQETCDANPEGKQIPKVYGLGRRERFNGAPFDLHAVRIEEYNGSFFLPVPLFARP